MAKELELSLDETLKVMSIANSEAAGPVDEKLPTPEYVNEWHSAPVPCVTRLEVDGVLRHHFNETLLKSWTAQGVPASTLEMLARKGRGVDVRGPYDVDDALLSLFETQEGMRTFVALWVKLWSSVSPEDPYAQGEAQADRPVALFPDGVRVGPIRLQMRVVSRRNGRERWEAIRYQPVQGDAIEVAGIPPSPPGGASGGLTAPHNALAGLSPGSRRAPGAVLAAYASAAGGAAGAAGCGAQASVVEGRGSPGTRPPARPALKRPVPGPGTPDADAALAVIDHFHLVQALSAAGVDAAESKEADDEALLRQLLEICDDDPDAVQKTTGKLPMPPQPSPPPMVPPPGPAGVDLGVFVDTDYGKWLETQRASGSQPIPPPSSQMIPHSLSLAFPSAVGNSPIPSPTQTHQTRQ